MAEPYLEELSQIVDRLKPLAARAVALETRHFFSGAALYANGKICGSLSPTGFAIKLPKDVRQSLIDEGKGTEFRFFATGPIKREYIALPDSMIGDDRELQKLINVSISYTLGEAAAGAA